MKTNPFNLFPANPTQISFSAIARAALAIIGGASCAAGLFGLTAVMATSMATPTLWPVCALIAGLVLLCSGAGIILQAWRHSEAFRAQNMVLALNAVTSARNAARTPPTPTSPAGGRGNLRPVA